MEAVDTTVQVSDMAALLIGVPVVAFHLPVFVVFGLFGLSFFGL
ncbi:hypothetical protein [Paracoccus sulfuroxidans]|uniref:Uncharacterized protein n=1 Tax=Paracoccus sulfuroxidans TaxID=384678 RepID=A0A562NQL6_9RHOB|nr:hypothetical protein [Paracoccus sulfuroxidans]TWI34497.1 hypothetical protein IQ24_02015 [Paracoccus sulfuroxidans]